MNNYLAMAINVAYVVLAFWFLGKLNLKFIGNKASWTYGWAGMFITFTFFIIGLLLFDIPCGFWGCNNPDTIQRMKEVGWFIPSLAFLFFLTSLSLKQIVGYLRGKLDKENTLSQSLLSSSLLTASLLSFVLLAGFTDRELEPPSMADAPFLLFFWLLGTIIAWLITLGLRALLQFNRKRSNP